MKNEIVLVVEDDALVSELLGVVLENDFQVIFAGTGEVALTKARTLKPDLVLLDLGLPDMSGFQVMCILRQHVLHKCTPILVLSGEEAATGKRAAKAGANGYICKPYSPRYLLDRIETLMGRGEGC